MTSLYKVNIRHDKNQKKQVHRACELVRALKTTEHMEYTVNISRFEKNKTQAQLGYYWGVIIPELMRFQGCSAIEADHVLKTELVPPRITMIMEVVIHIRASIAKMKIKEMAEYIDNCVHFLGTWGVVVPPPPYKGEDYDKKNTSNKRKSV